MFLKEYIFFFKEERPSEFGGLLQGLMSGYSERLRAFIENLVKFSTKFTNIFIAISQVRTDYYTPFVSFCPKASQDLYKLFFNLRRDKKKNTIKMFTRFY